MWTTYIVGLMVLAMGMGAGVVMLSPPGGEDRPEIQQQEVMGTRGAEITRALRRFHDDFPHLFPDVRRGPVVLSPELVSVARGSSGMATPEGVAFIMTASGTFHAIVADAASPLAGPKFARVMDTEGAAPHEGHRVNNPREARRD